MSRTFPVGPSPVLAGLEWLGGREPYPVEEVKGDTFPLTWADDGEIYASCGDPLWSVGTYDAPEQPGRSGLDVEAIVGRPPGYEIRKLNDMPDYVGWGGDGPKPSGMISVGGVLYLAFQNMLGRRPPAHGEKSQHGSDAAIVTSADHGLTWRPELGGLEGPLFPGSGFGGPSFVQFGRDNAGARDGFVYAVSGDQWDNGTHLRVGRVPAGRIAERTAWEFVAGFDASGAPSWTGDLAASAPVLSDARHLGLPEMVHLAAVDRYLLLTWGLFADFSTRGSELTLYDAPEPWGPFTLVHHESPWEEPEVTPYCPRVPLKWLEPDGLTGWMLYSGSWAQGSPYYRANVRRFRLMTG